jgi:hypothetical protein
MSMPTTDYNQQLLCYLQNWRQLLEQWAAMAAGSPFLTAPPVLPTAPAGGQFMPPYMPFMPPFMPFMPPMPMGPPTAAAQPVSPAPADYTQQLFGYLQAWRQYLEQAAGASPARPQAWTPPTPTTVTADDGGKSGPNRPPNRPPSPDGPAWGEGVSQSDDSENSDAIPPKVIDRPPFRWDQTQLTEVHLDPLATPFDRPGEPFQMPDPAVLAARPITSYPLPEATAQPDVGSAFLRTMSNVEPTALPQVEPRSLFSTPGASTSFREHGETPSP